MMNLEEARNIEMLKNLYMDYYDDSLITEISSVSGKTFKMISESVNFTSILEGGYVILPTGEFIPIKDRQDHDDVFSLFIYYYTDADKFIEYNSLEGCSILNKLGIVVYFGTKMGYIPEINNQESVDNYLKKMDLNKGYGVLSFPGNKILTNTQRVNISQFLLTNHKQTPTGFRELLSLSYGNLENNILYTPEELNELLTPVEKELDLTNAHKKL